MRQSIRRCAFFSVGILSALAVAACDDMSTLGGHGESADPGTGDDDAGSTDDGSASDDGGNTGNDSGDGLSPSDCDYKDDKSFCDCLGGWDCGATTAMDKGGQIHAVYCGTCSGTTFCQPGSDGPGTGKCGGTNPLLPYQKQKIDMLVAMGENDQSDVAYSFAKDLTDGRGYTIGKVGFCTGTGDFIWVAACYNNLKPTNVLSKYWGHRDTSGKAIDGLIYYNDQAILTGNNQGDTKLLDSLGNFVADVKTASDDPDGLFNGCQDAVADALYMSAALQHASERGMSGAMTIGFLYDMELNFGDDDDGSGGLGTKSVMKNADVAYGAGLPTSFTGKPWEESKWLGLLIKERTVIMAKDATWKSDMDQNATWEAARRLHTAKTNSPENDKTLNMDYELVSKYKAASALKVTPCFTGLASTEDTQASIISVTTDKSAAPTDDKKWKAVAKTLGGNYAACPADPTGP
jgi:hypothetical protein